MSVVVGGRTRESQDLHSHTCTPSTLVHISHLPPRLILPLPPHPVRHPPHPDGPSGPVATQYELARGTGSRQKTRCGAQQQQQKKGTCVHALLTCTLAPQPHARQRASKPKNAPPQQLVRKVRPLALSVGVASLARLCSSLTARGLVRGGAYAYGGGVGWLLLMLVAAGRWYIAGCVVRCRFSLGSRCWHVQVRF